MRKRNTLRLEYLSKLMSYNPETGRLFWKVATADMFPDGKGYAERSAARWNTIHAGKEAIGTRHKQGYIRIGIRGTQYYAHVLAWALSTGRWPALDVDHINQNTSDNRLENLREISHVRNMRNQSMRRNNTSGVTGVSRSKGGWVAIIGGSLGREVIGWFGNFDDAVAARRRAERLNGYHQSHGV